MLIKLAKQQCLQDYSLIYKMLYKLRIISCFFKKKSNN